MRPKDWYNPFLKTPCTIWKLEKNTILHSVIDSKPWKLTVFALLVKFFTIAEKKMVYHYFRSNGTERRGEQFYKFLEEDKFVDLTLLIEDGMEVKAHKVILSSATEFFDNIFQQCKNKNTESFVIFLSGIKFLQLKSTVENLSIWERQLSRRRTWAHFCWFQNYWRLKIWRRLNVILSPPSVRIVVSLNEILEKAVTTQLKLKFRIILMKNSKNNERNFKQGQEHILTRTTSDFFLH